MRTYVFVLCCVLAAASAIAASDGFQDDSASAHTSRGLLQGRNGAGAAGGLGAGNGASGGVRSFSEVSAHKQPRTPTLTRKNFDRQVPLRHMLSTDGIASAQTSRELLQGRNGAGAAGGLGSGNGAAGGVRSFSEVSAHKQPRVPTLTRKNFDRQVPLRH